MQLVGIAHGRGAAFEIADVAAFVGNDQGALKLTGLRSVNPKVGRKLHGATNSLGNITKRSIAEDRGIERCKEVITVGNHGA